MSQKLGSDFKMFNKACHVCGSFDHLKNDCNNWYNNGRFVKPVWTNVQRVNKQNFSKLTHPSPKRNLVPRTVVTRSGPISVNAVRLVNTIQSRTAVNNARPMKNIINNAYSTTKRPFNKITAANNNNFTKKVNIVKGTRVNTARPKADLSVVKRNKGNVIKASACWVWRPTHKVLDHVSRNNGASMSFKRFDYIDAQGIKSLMLGGLTCLFAKATPDESNLWHRRLGHVNFKTMNKQKGETLFSWVFFLAIKDETSEILKTFITGIKNLIDLRVKVIRCDNGTEFKNRVMNQFYEIKGIKREFSVARTPQQNGVAEKKNRTLIEAAKTMLADSKLPITFWAEAVNTACYVQNKVLVIKPHNKTPYELFLGRKHALSFMRPFGCPVTILNTIDHLGKFDGNVDEVFFVGYSTNSKAFRVQKHVMMHGKARMETVPGKRITFATSFELPNDPNTPELEDIIYSDDDEDVGYTKEEGIDYDKVFAPVARIEAIRLFLAYALFKDFVVYQMDVKSAFLYGKIEEEVYVCQPPGFEDSDFPDKVYKVEKALYGLHQAPRAWYETLSTYLLENGFQRGQIDQTLFIKRDQGDILIVQVYIDDIIFWSKKKKLCTEFEKMMHKKFQMSSMGELTFFLGLQVKQKEDGIFISQDKYVTEILKKFGFSDVKTANTPMETHKPLLKDADGEDVDEHMYRLMIGSLMYLTSSRPDIIYLKGQPKLGLWYPKDSPFDLVAYTDSDYAGASLDRKSTTGGCQFLGCRLISWQCKKQTVVANSIIEAEYVAASSCYGQVLWIQNQLLDYGYNFMHTKIYIDNESTICIVKNHVFH
ncbi:putative ribonuclease H-like domain-containing protein [Tanacetum coccineum]|uniref:Ribonuclease H-like domain-containing protein n=1 Tax=Tanacetum coccineum TaxID=301880 RepID=A0ABQ4YKT1_9ASTR